MPNTNIPVEKIKQNPWRNLELYPINKEQVTRLVQSVNQHGFLGGVKARAINGHYELACGHHRIEAVREIGLKEVIIVVEDMSDDTMIKLMCDENATQSGAIAAAIMNEVSAATKRIFGAIMRCEEPSEISEGSIISKLFINKATQSFTNIKTALEEGNGLGSPIIMQYLGEGDEKKCPRKKQQIIDALNALKDSGLYTSIIKEIEAEIKTEDEAEKLKTKQAEERAKEAEATQAVSNLRNEANRQHKISERATKTRQNAARAKKNSEDKYPRILDEHCASVFANDFQFSAFKEAVTSEAGKRFIPINQQLPLAQQLMQELTAKAKDAKRVGAPFIKQYVATIIDQAIAKQSLIDKEEKDRLRAEQTLQSFRDDIDNLRAPLNRIISLGTKILEQISEHPDFINDSISGTIEIKIDEVMSTLKEIKKHF
jgi:hypothetical protein